MQDQYFLKDKKAMIYWGKENGKDEDGYPESGGLVPFAPAQLWCYTKQLSQEQHFSAMAYGEGETRLFVFNHLEGVGIYDRIQYRGEWYSITRVDTKDDYNGDLYVYVKECPKGDIPKDGDILDYEEYSR